MKIIKCMRCGRFIYKSRQCYYCGNVDEFQDCYSDEVNENVSLDYHRMESLLEDKKYDEVISLSYSVLEWMPNLSGAYWLRLLARKRCNTLVELISIGVFCEEDPDFCNALRFSKGEEKNVYIEIQKVMQEFKKNLVSEIHKHEYYCKCNTNIMDIKGEIYEKIKVHSQKLFSMWSELEKKENELRTIELDCKLLVREHQLTIQSAAQRASTLKSESYRLERCLEKELHSIQVKIGNAYSQSEEARQCMETIGKQHPWIKEFSNVERERNNIVQQISRELVSVQNYENLIKKTINDIEVIEKRHKTAQDNVEKYNFYDAAIVLGNANFTNALHNSGVVGSCIGIPIEEWSLTSAENSNIHNNKSYDSHIED